MIRFLTIIHTLCLVTAMTAGTLTSARAGDLWRDATEAGVMTTNDCGHVSAVAGAAYIRRSYMMDDGDGLEAHVADRLNAGDAVEVSHQGRLELVCGRNTVLVIGPGTRVRLDGLRSFDDANGRRVSRLDVTLERGELRFQVRRNDTNPDAVLAAVSGAEILLTRGDAIVLADAAWRATTLDGEAHARVRRGGVTGAPFTFAAGDAVWSGGEERMAEDAMATMQRRLPFSFEVTRAALPPRPAAGANWEAP